MLCAALCPAPFACSVPELVVSDSFWAVDLESPIKLREDVRTMHEQGRRAGDWTYRVVVLCLPCFSRKTPFQLLSTPLARLYAHVQLGYSCLSCVRGSQFLMVVTYYLSGGRQNSCLLARCAYSANSLSVGELREKQEIECYLSSRQCFHIPPSIEELDVMTTTLRSAENKLKRQSRGAPAKGCISAAVIKRPPMI